MHLSYVPTIAGLGISPTGIKYLYMGVHGIFICNKPQIGTNRYPSAGEWLNSGASASWATAQQCRRTDSLEAAKGILLSGKASFKGHSCMIPHA